MVRIALLFVLHSTYMSIVEHTGLKQLLMLVATGDPRCQGVAAEVMCLAAANDSVSALLTPMYVCMYVCMYCLLVF